MAVFRVVGFGGGKTLTRFNAGISKLESLWAKEALGVSKQPTLEASFAAI
ncbi:nuclease [Sesbania bispinosa]|nr:nuclease [Sesbania bispinosa]